MMKQTKFFLEWIPEYMKKHDGWLKVRRAFRDVTKQKVGDRYKTHVGKVNVWQMQNALQILKRKGLIYKYGNGIWRLKE